MQFQKRFSHHPHKKLPKKIKMTFYRFVSPPIAIMQNLPTLAKTSTGYIVRGL